MNNTLNRDSYPKPVNMENRQAIAVEAKSFHNPFSGAQFGFDVVIITPDGEEVLSSCFLFSFERMEKHPIEVLALLERKY